RLPPIFRSTRLEAFGVLAGLCIVSLWQLLLAAPTIIAVAPALGQPGDVVTIRGSGFPTDPAQIDVRFGPNRAPVLSSTVTELVVQVPNGQSLAETRVIVNGSNPRPFFTIARSKIPTPPNGPKCSCCVPGASAGGNESVAPSCAQLGGGS